jgi:hypothetical protein
MSPGRGFQGSQNAALPSAFGRFHCFSSGWRLRVKIGRAMSV